MRAIQQTAWGGVEELRLVDVADPEPLPTEVLVRVVAAGVNPVDLFTREGKAYQRALDLPFVPGWDVAGVVERIGYGVTRFAPGDHVYGMPWFPRQAGGYAEFVTAPARHLAHKPASIGFDAAAALPLAGLTAWHMLTEVAGVQPGQRVLVNGAAGGVGHLAVQLAKHLGATVIGAARPSKHDFVRSLGADVTIGHTTPGNVGDIEPVDVVIELVGGEICLALLDALVPGGILVSAQGAWAPGLREAARSKGVRASWYLVEPDHHGLETLARLVDDGALQVHVGGVAPLAEAADVHRRLAAGDIRGKFVLRPTADIPATP